MHCIFLEKQIIVIRVNYVNGPYNHANLFEFGLYFQIFISGLVYTFNVSLCGQRGKIRNETLKVETNLTKRLCDGADP